MNRSVLVIPIVTFRKMDPCAFFDVDVFTWSRIVVELHIYANASGRQCFMCFVQERSIDLLLALLLHPLHIHTIFHSSHPSLFSCKHFCLVRFVFPSTTLQYTATLSLHSSIFILFIPFSVIVPYPILQALLPRVPLTSTAPNDSFFWFFYTAACSVRRNQLSIPADIVLERVGRVLALASSQVVQRMIFKVCCRPSTLRESKFLVRKAWSFVRLESSKLAWFSETLRSSIRMWWRRVEFRTAYLTKSAKRRFS